MVRLGTAAEVPLRIRIRNISQKPRQFNLDVDGGDVEVVSLGPSPMSNSPTVSAASVVSTSSAAAQMALLSCRCAFQLVALEPRPPVSHTLGGAPFNSDNVNAEGGGFGQAKSSDPGGAYKTGGGSKTSEEQQVMEDKLEFFNQKLKIAVRKVKIDKVEKYRNKIRDMMTMLSIPQVTKPNERIPNLTLLRSDRMLCMPLLPCHVLPQSQASTAYLEAEIMLATAAAEEQKQQALEGEGVAQIGLTEGGIADEEGTLVVEGGVEGACMETTAVTATMSTRTMATDDDEGSLPGESGGGVGALLASLVNESLGINSDKGVHSDPDAIPDHSHHSDVSSNLSPRWSPRHTDLSVSPALMMIQESATDENDHHYRDPSVNPLMRSGSQASGLSTSPSTVSNLLMYVDQNTSNKTLPSAPADFAPLTMVSQFQLVLSPGEERVVLAWVPIALTSDATEKINSAAVVGRNVIAEALEGNKAIGDVDAAEALAAPQMFLVAGKVRVFEQRNQDLVRAVPFSCQVMFPFQRQEPLTRVSPSRGGRVDMTSQEEQLSQATAENDVGMGADVTALVGVVSGGQRTTEVTKKEKAWAGSRIMEMPATTTRRESFPAVPLPLLAMSRLVGSAAADDTDGQGAITPLANTDATITPLPSPRSLSRRPSSVMAAITTGGSGSAVAMEAISEEIHSPQHSSTASNPTALNKPSHVPSSQLVTFPDLELDEATGKW